ncbi:MAG: DUF2270 domain-containing protein [Planctomycetota bacterium]
MVVDPGGASAAGNHPSQRVDYESESLERSSYITAIVHLYRGEISRANTWRNRLDQTTHWAILVTLTSVSFAFGQEQANHFSLLFANVLLVILLGLEARRFRFFDVWRARVRKIETNFFAPILQRRLDSPERDWMLLVADDLIEPHFHMTRLESIRERLVRNYLPIFGVVLVAWLIKLSVHPSPSFTAAELYARCSVGPLPGWLTLVTVAIFYAGLGSLVVFGNPLPRRTNNWDIQELMVDEYL